MFSRAEILPYLGEGKEATIDEASGFLTTGGTCRVDIDGKTGFSATGLQLKEGQSFHHGVPEGTDPIDFGRNGWVYDGGASVEFTCRAPGKTTEVRLQVHGYLDSDNKADARPTHKALLRKYFDFAHRELNCRS
ncbi:hypothetical protein [Streptomyces sp. NPDC002054]|uniref:hypothetical protein n=1 Tax=Streptomyces sp. NPDC002054 TaxID=3154663 RepID=UPI00331A9320